MKLTEREQKEREKELILLAFMGGFNFGIVFGLIVGLIVTWL